MCVCMYVICMLRDKIWEWPGDEAMYVCCYTGQLEWLCSHCKLSDIMVIGLGQPAKPLPSLVPAIINITWSHRTIHYFHLCMYAFHWVQGSCCAGIEPPRDTKLSPGLCSSLTRKVTHQWGDSGMIASFPGSPRLGEGRAWERGYDDWTEQLMEAAH